MNDEHQTLVEAAAEAAIATPPTTPAYQQGLSEPSFGIEGEGTASPPSDPMSEAAIPEPPVESPAEPPLIDNKDVEQDIRPMFHGTTLGKLQGAYWFKEDGKSLLKVRLGWETLGDVRSMRFKPVDGRVEIESADMPPGQVITEFYQIKDDGGERDGSAAPEGMSKRERISMETLGKYYLVSVVQVQKNGRFQRHLCRSL